jgi:hypothetical protein
LRAPTIGCKRYQPPVEPAVQLPDLGLLLGHSNLATTSKYLRITTSQVCATATLLRVLSRPLDALQVMTPVVPDLVPA